MINRVQTMIALMKINFKTLIAFEVLYRLLGFLIIFPLINFILQLALSISGYVYISNRNAIAFLTSPSSIIAAVVIVIIFAMFMIVELLFLSLLYHYSEQGIKINFTKFLSLGSKHVLKTLKTHHIKLILPAFFFIVIVHLMHFAGIASTFDIPPVILEEMQTYQWLMVLTYMTLLFLFIMFIETFFIINIANIENGDSLKLLRGNLFHLKKHRLKIIIEFILLNLVLNLFLYVLYLGIIGLVALFIMLAYQQAVVLAFLLTILYVIYAAIAFLATLILIPVNFAWMSAWYYENANHQISLKFPMPTNSAIKNIFKNAWVRLSVAVILLALFVLNTINTINLISQDRLPLAFLNPPDIVAHRGSSLSAPENTIASIKQGLEDGANGIEIDIHLSSDGEIVLIHDYTTGRTTDDATSRLVRDLTYEELSLLDAGSWFSDEFAGEHIPTLKEALLLIDGQADVYIDLKTTAPGIEDKVISLLYELEYDLSTVQILAFSNSALERFKAEEPELKTVLLMPNFIGNFDRLIRLPYVDAYAFRKDILLNNEHYVDAIHRLDKSVYVWTVNDKNELREMTLLGLDAIITDDPILAREVAYSQYTRSLYTDILRELFSD